MRRVGQLALVWLALFWLWLAFQGEWSPSMVVAAASSATVATALAAWVRRWFPLGYRLQRQWALRGLRVPWLVLKEFALMTRVLATALVRRERIAGSFRLSPFPVGGNEPVARARRAFVAIAETYSPNSYVVGMYADEGGVLIHDLDPKPPERGVL